MRDVSSPPLVTRDDLVPFGEDHLGLDEAVAEQEPITTGAVAHELGVVDRDPLAGVFLWAAVEGDHLTRLEVDRLVEVAGAELGALQVGEDGHHPR